MRVTALDLSLTCTGWAKHGTDGITVGTFTPQGRGVPRLSMRRPDRGEGEPRHKEGS